MTVLHGLVVGHQGLGPVHHADADAEHGEGGAQAEQQVLQVDLAERLTVPDLPHAEVADEEEHRAHDGDEEHDRDLTLGALRSLRILIGQARTVRRQARVVDRVPGRVLAGVLEEPERCSVPSKPFSPICPVSFTRVMNVDDGWSARLRRQDQEDRLVSQTMKPMISARPAVQMNRPSETGPSEPRARPPGSPGSRWSSGRR